MNTSFERTEKGTEEWLTPPEMIKALGPFDLDPCAPINRPWPMATQHYTVIDNGLLLPWNDKVYCNPPYGNETGKWLARCAEHGNAIALTFARTETKMFFDVVWNRADAVLFLKGRIKFYHVDGTIGGSAGAPSVLIAYGRTNIKRLEQSGISGKLIIL